MTRLVGALTAVALAVVALVHLDLAPRYASIGSPSLGAQFRAQAVVAGLLALVLLVRPRAAAWAVTAAFGAASLAALVWSRYRDLPVPGFDGGFRETWEAEGAVTSAVAEAAVVVLALAGLALALRHRRRSHRPS